MTSVRVVGAGPSPPALKVLTYARVSSHVLLRRSGRVVSHLTNLRGQQDADSQQSGRVPGPFDPPQHLHLCR